MYYSIGKTIKSKVWFRTSACFFIKIHHVAETTQHWSTNDPSTIFLASSFTQKKKVESSDTMFFSIFMLENIWYHNFTWSELNSLEIVIFVPIMDPRRLELSRNRMNNFLWIQSTLDKVMIYGIFRVKLVAKNSAWVP